MEEGSDGVLGNGVEEIVEQIMGSRVSPTSPNDDRLRFERLQMQRIRELDMEQLEVEDADSDFGSILSDNGSRSFHQSISPSPLLPSPPRPFSVLRKRHEYWQHTCVKIVSVRGIRVFSFGAIQAGSSLFVVILSFSWDERHGTSGFLLRATWMWCVFVVFDNSSSRAKYVLSSRTQAITSWI